MATNTSPGTSLQRQVLENLIHEQGLNAGEYTLFFVTGEGKFFPVASHWAGVEESSGFVLDKHGHVFMFWLGWDIERGSPGLIMWEEVAPEPHWRRAPEYAAARQKLGLPAAS